MVASRHPSSRSVGTRPVARPHLHLVVDNTAGKPGTAAIAPSVAPMVGLVAVVLFGGLFGLRLAQESSPPEMLGGTVAAVATSTPDVAVASGAGLTAGPGSGIVVVHPGDSLWSIAVSRYPERDPREVVDAFVEVNGTSVIRSGQQLIVPAALLDD